jgi:N-methylhydantoinase A
VFAIRDDDSIVEFLNWKGRVTVQLDRPSYTRAVPENRRSRPRSTRPAYFGAGKRLATPVVREGDIRVGSAIIGPAIVEMPTTTIIVYPGMTVKYSPSGNFVLEGASGPAAGAKGARQ